MIRFLSLLLLLGLTHISWAYSWRHVSGTRTDAGTIASLERTGSNTLPHWLFVTAHNNVTNVGHTGQVTYTDDTSTSRTVTTGGNRMLFATPGGMLELNGGSYNAFSALTNTPVKRLSATADGSGTGTRSMLASAIDSSTPYTVRKSGGTTTTNGATVASISASGSNRLLFVRGMAAQTSATNNQLTITVTYTDDSTTVVSTIDGGRHAIINESGIIVSNGYGLESLTPLSAKSIKSVAVTASGGGTSTRAATLSALEVDSDANLFRAAGSSTTGSGAVVAEYAAASGKRLVGWHCFAAQTQAANTNLTVTITYTDDSTTSLSTGANALRSIHASSAGLMYMTGADIEPGQNKDVKRVSVITAGVGTGTRAAILSGVEESISTTTATKFVLLNH